MQFQDTAVHFHLSPANTAVNNLSHASPNRGSSQSVNNSQYEVPESLSLPMSSQQSLAQNPSQAAMNNPNNFYNPDPKVGMLDQTLGQEPQLSHSVERRLPPAGEEHTNSTSATSSASRPPHVLSNNTSTG